MIGRCWRYPERDPQCQKSGDWEANLEIASYKPTHKSDKRSLFSAMALSTGGAGWVSQTKPHCATFLSLGSRSQGSSAGATLRASGGALCAFLPTHLRVSCTVHISWGPTVTDLLFEIRVLERMEDGCKCRRSSDQLLIVPSLLQAILLLETSLQSHR